MAIFTRAILTEDDFKLDCDLGINNAGYTMAKSIDIKTDRPNGRKDYQMIYVKSGKVYITFNGERHMLKPGQIFLYYPAEPQLYEMFGKDKPEIFWIHFSGNKVDELLEKAGISGMHIINSRVGYKPIETASKIINEIRNRDRMYEERINSLFIMLLIYIGRGLESTNEKKTDNLSENIREYIEEHYFEDTANSEYAERFGISESSLVKVFKRRFGVTPQQYKNDCKIRNAQNMLIVTNKKISDISRIVGFNDSLYFCRTFKKATEMTPGEYRKKFKNT